MLKAKLKKAKKGKKGKGKGKQNPFPYKTAAFKQTDTCILINNMNKVTKIFNIFMGLF